MFGLSDNFQNTLTRVVKYALVFCVIYLLLRVVPKTPLCSRDNFIISLIITSVYVLYDMYVCGKKEHLEDTSKLNDQLNSILSKINTTNPDLAASLSNLKTQVTNTVNQQVQPSDWTWRLTADWVRKSSAAARVKLRWRAAASKARSAPNGGSRRMVFVR